MGCKVRTLLVAFEVTKEVLKKELIFWLFFMLLSCNKEYRKFHHNIDKFNVHMIQFSRTRRSFILTTLMEFRSAGVLRWILSFPLGTEGGSLGISLISSINVLGILNFFIRYTLHAVTSFSKSTSLRFSEFKLTCCWNKPVSKNIIKSL